MSQSRIITHIETMVSRTLSINKHGIADANKVNKIEIELTDTMSGMVDIDAIKDYVISVILMTEDTISVSVVVKLTSKSGFICIPAILRTILPTDKTKNSFDRAMKGI